MQEHRLLVPELKVGDWFLAGGGDNGEFLCKVTELLTHDYERQYKVKFLNSGDVTTWEDGYTQQHTVITPITKEVAEVIISTTLKQGN